MTEFLYASQIQLALDAHENGQPAAARRILGHHRDAFKRYDLLGMEWALLNQSHANLVTTRLAAHEGNIHEILYLPTQKRIVSAGEDGRICIWDAETHQLEQQIEVNNPIHGLAVSKDGNHLAVGTMAITLFDLSTSPPTEKWSVAQPEVVESIAFAPNGEQLVAGTRYAFVATYSTLDGSLINSHDNSGRIPALAYTSNNELLVPVKHDLEDSLRFMTSDFESNRRSIAGIRGFSISPNGLWLAASLQNSRQLDLYGTLRSKLFDRFELPGDSQFVFTVANERLAAGFENGDLRVWNINVSPTGAPSIDRTSALEVQTHEAMITALTFAGNDMLLSGTADGQLKTWSLETSNRWRPTGPVGLVVERMTIHPRENVALAITRSVDSSTSLWRGDLSSDHWYAVPNMQNSPSDIAWSKAGDLAVVSGQQGELTVIGIGKSSPLEMRPLKQHRKENQAPINAVAFTSTGAIAETGSDQSLNIWSPQFELLDTQPLEGTGHCLQIARDKPCLLVGGEFPAIVVYDSAGQRVVTRIPIESDCHDLAWHPFREEFASSHANGNIILWDAREDPSGWKPKHILHGHNAFAQLAFSPDGRTLVSASQDQQVRLWHVNRGASMGRLTRTNGACSHILFGNDNRLLISGDFNVPANIMQWQWQGHKRGT